MGKTIAEKILGAHCSKEVSAGGIALCDVDFCFSQDGTSSIVIDSFKKLGVSKPLDSSKFAMFIDHNAPSPNLGASNIHRKMRNFAREYRIKLYDIGEGVSHQLIFENVLAKCGQLVMGADSHTCSAGLLNAFAAGFGSTDIAVSLACGKNWFRVPETIKIVINGKFPSGVYAKDVILHIIGKRKADSATYKAIEFEGEVIESLSLSGRFTICNMAVEMGAKTALMRANRKVLNWISRRSKEKIAEAITPDSNARYCEVEEFDISQLNPQIAKPHSVDNVVDISELEGLEIDEAFLGTCTNGRLEDLEIAAKILKGKKVNPKLKFIVAPASKEVYLEALKKGVLETLISSGASVVSSAGCGPCVGTHQGVPSDGDRVISTANRNFKGRMGNPNASVYLASPATVATSAIEGKISDPRKFL